MKPNGNAAHGVTMAASTIDERSSRASALPRTRGRGIVDLLLMVGVAAQLALSTVSWAFPITATVTAADITTAITTSAAIADAFFRARPSGAPE